jgi:hypothetical protein
LRGLGAPAPVDDPLTVKTYAVRYSDADEIFWRPDLIAPIPPAEDRLEAQVRFETDELGFRNASPLPPAADVVVLGRSYALGAQNGDPWPSQLAEVTGWQVVNLSEPGSSMEVKLDYLRRFGLPRHPRWVIVEVMPALDSINYRPAPPFLIQLLPIPLAQQFAWQISPPKQRLASHPVYPLAVELPARTIQLTCCIHYLDVLTLDQQTLTRSRGWQLYTQTLLDLVHAAQAQYACVALLYAPMKPEIYFPSAVDPAQLEPALAEVRPLKLAGDGELVADTAARPDIVAMQAQALAGRDALADFALTHQLTLIDPTQRMVEAALEGDSPFMAYDSHWNSNGHQIVAQAVAAALRNASCP